MRNFKKGDKVVCVRVIINKKTHKSYTNITKGSLYEVMADSRDDTICITNDLGFLYYYPAKRFKLVNEYRDCVIDSILD